MDLDTLVFGHIRLFPYYKLRFHFIFANEIAKQHTLFLSLRPTPLSPSQKYTQFSTLDDFHSTIASIVTVIVAATATAALIRFQILKSYILLCAFVYTLSSIVFNEIKYAFASCWKFHLCFWIGFIFVNVKYWQFWFLATLVYYIKPLLQSHNFCYCNHFFTLKSYKIQCVQINKKTTRTIF